MVVAIEPPKNEPEPPAITLPTPAPTSPANPPIKAPPTIVPKLAPGLRACDIAPIASSYANHYPEKLPTWIRILQKVV